MSGSGTGRLPAVFLGHGSPMNALESNVFTRAWAALGAGVPRPAAVLAVSAHWYTRGTGVTAMERPRKINDFGGFPQELHDFPYPAAGDPQLAARVAELLAPTDVAQDDRSWGLDHGTWSVLAHVFPRADVPVVQLSIDGLLRPQDHLELGRRLAPLRDEGVLIVGSGNIVHNLGTLRWSDTAPPYDWALRFDRRVRDALRDGDDATLVGYAADPDARLAVPDPTHYLPLLYIAGTRLPGEQVTELVDGCVYSSLTMTSVRVG